MPGLLNASTTQKNATCNIHDHYKNAKKRIMFKICYRTLYSFQKNKKRKTPD